ncbi:prephenate dehydrogenase/arogenate dehydrogenase family protein [Methanofollis fontis]|uniref:Prephenate dehydrogenase/arogenate dehydrogenase family protein n=1 Tax=Methanofollis fontis TaxID=2052832 RepID=A0A483CW21_9EURY|nr:prephenate dehydrogenase/arogenate dehydrogenase family protein [Methanofollis fontis]TAJ45350.1 prephenate dehydrogenase/arogenate dehydrogenase family protein [Methanofollis fontis]
MHIGIIGGTGGMGSFFARTFAAAGHEVSVSGRHTAVTNAWIAEHCDLVVVSVPIRATAAVIREIAPLLRPEQSLCDLTSLKAVPVAAMLETEAAVLGLHPMFGPSVASLRGQTIIACPARIDPERQEEVLGIFRAEGAQITEMDPLEHDRLMAVVQALTHYATLTVAGTIRRLGIDLDALLSATSPVYRIETALVGRILGQDPDLYGPILQENPAVPEVLAAFSDAAVELSRAVVDGDEQAFTEIFAADARYFSGYIPQATEDSEVLVRCLSER